MKRLVIEIGFVPTKAREKVGTQIGSIATKACENQLQSIIIIQLATKNFQLSLGQSG